MLIFAFPCFLLCSNKLCIFYLNMIFFIRALVGPPRRLTKFCCTSQHLLKYISFYAILIQNRVQELQSQLNVEIRTHQQAREQLLTSTRDMDSVELRVSWRIYPGKFRHLKLLTSDCTEIQRLFWVKKENDLSHEFCYHSAHKLKPNFKQLRSA